jgi:hypothetical protein
MPYGRVRREPVVTGPRVTLVLLEPEEVADLLRIPDALEDAHVLARRRDECAVDRGVDGHDRVDDVVLGAHLGIRELVRVGAHEVAPQMRGVRDAPDRPRRHRLGEIDEEVAIEVGVHFVLRLEIVVHHVEREMVRELGIDAVARETSAEPVAPVALDRHRADGDLAAHQRPGLVAQPYESAAAMDLERRLLAVARALPTRRAHEVRHHAHSSP